MRLLRLLSLVMLLLSVFFVHAQDDTSMAVPLTSSKENLPYMKYPEMPAFNIMLTDSSTIFNTYNVPKGQPTLFIFFDPDCKHCRLVTKKIIGGMDSLKNVQMYWVTHVHSMTAIKKFMEDNHFDKYPNIKVVGRDYEFFYGEYYGVTLVPDFVLFNDQKMFIKYFEGSTTVADLYEWFNKKN